MSGNICSICSNNMNKKPEGLQELLKEAVLTGEMMNPGGRALKFKATGEKHLQLADYCSHCDYQKIRQFIRNNCMPEHTDKIRGLV
jgi:hypothetical protein